MSSPATAFERSLRSVQTGGVTYGDFLADLKQTLADGASAAELQEVLGRRQAIEPMLEQAYEEVAGILADAVRAAAAEIAVSDAANASGDGVLSEPRDLAESTPKEVPLVVKALRNSGLTPMPGGRSRPAGRIPAAGGAPQLFSIASVPTEAADSAAAARAMDLANSRSALEAAQNKTREITELARARIAEVLKETERWRNESSKLRELLAERDAQLSALRQEHESVAPALEARAGTLALELVAARNALQAEQLKSAGVQELRDALAARDTEISAREAELAARDADRSARDASVAALKEEYAKTLRAHEARASSRAHLESDLQSALAQSSSLAAELATTRRALEDQRSKGAQGSAVFADKVATAEAARSQAENALRAAEQQLRTADQQLRAAEHHQSDARHLRESLAAREAELAGIRQEQTKTARLVESRVERATQLQADLEAARARVQTVEAELKASQDAAGRLVANLKRREAELDTARSELGAVKAQSSSYLESLRNREWRQSYEHSRDPDNTAALAPPSPEPPVMARTAPPPPSAPPKTLPPQHTSPISVAPTVPPIAAPPLVAPASTARTGAATAGGTVEHSPIDGSGGIRRTAALAAALLALVVVGWLIARHKAAPSAAASPPAADVTAGSVIQDCATCPTFTVLPAGRFKQGSVPTDPGYSAFEGPQHWVVLARSLALSTNPITVDQFAQFVEATGRDMQGCDTYDGGWKSRPDASWKNPGFTQAGDHPVTCVSFNDATAYAQWLSVQTGRLYRLPSASEWEYAARAGGAAVPWENAAEACANANVADATAARRYPGWQVFACDDGFANTSPVGSFKANAFGLNDMLGNVFQWTEDCWNGDYTGAPVDGSAWISGDCGLHELRGGSWFSAPKFVHAGYRNQFAADYRTSSVGIRLVREL